MRIYCEFQRLPTPNIDEVRFFFRIVVREASEMWDHTKKLAYLILQAIIFQWQDEDWTIVNRSCRYTNTNERLTPFRNLHGFRAEGDGDSWICKWCWCNVRGVDCRCMREEDWIWNGSTRGVTQNEKANLKKESDEEKKCDAAAYEAFRLKIWTKW